MELREKIHRTTSLLARRIVAEVSKKSFSGETIGQFNIEADNEILALCEEQIKHPCEICEYEYGDDGCEQIICPHQITNKEIEDRVRKGKLIRD